MQVLIFAIMPIFSIIALGFVLKHYFFKSRRFWDYLDKLTYYILMPSMLMYRISQSKIEGTYEAFTSVGVILTVLVLISALSILFNLFLKLNGPAFTSFFQGSIRYNTYVYLAVIEQFLGESGVVIGAIFIAFAIPLINVMCIGIFGIYTNKKSASLYGALKQILQNPMILSCVIGGVINIFGINLFFVPNILLLLGSSAITIGLISIGANLKFSVATIKDKALYSASFIKLVLFPLLCFMFCLLLDLPDIFVVSCVLFAAMPTAPTSYILAGQLGGDKSLMSIIITFQTVVCFFTIWLIMDLLGRYFA